MKSKFYILFILFIAFGISLVSCKKSSPAPAPVSSMSVTINGVNYSGNSQMTYTNASSGALSYVTNGSAYYGCYTYTSSTSTFPNNFVFTQMNIVSGGDTIFYEIQLSSLNAITTGSYTVTAPNDLNNPSNNYIAKFAYYRTGMGTKGVTDSTCTGTLTLTQFDMSKKLVSGTFNLTDTRTSTSNPTKIIITNGQFANLILQEF